MVTYLGPAKFSDLNFFERSVLKAYQEHFDPPAFPHSLRRPFL